MKNFCVVFLFLIFLSSPAYSVCKIDEVMTGAACSIQKTTDKKVVKKEKLKKKKTMIKKLPKLITPKR